MATLIVIWFKEGSCYARILCDQSGVSSCVLNRIPLNIDQDRLLWGAVLLLLMASQSHCILLLFCWMPSVDSPVHSSVVWLSILKQPAGIMC